MIKSLIKSKRFFTAAAGMLVVVLAHFGLSEQEANEITRAAEIMVGLLIGGFSLRDPGQSLRQQVAGE